MEKSTKQIIFGLSALAVGIAVYQSANVPKILKDGRTSEGAPIRRWIGGSLIAIVGVYFLITPFIKIKGWK